MTALARIDDATIERARSRPSREVIGRFVALRKEGKLWSAPCPFHSERSPSFIVYPTHFHCFGCGSHGDNIEFLMRHRGLDFKQAVAELANIQHPSTAARFEQGIREAAREYAEVKSGRFESDEEERGRMAEARAIWANRKPIAGTLAETYLRTHRKITGKLPPTLGFATGLYFSPLKQARPALLAAIQDGTGYVTAIQRIYLDAETGNKAEPKKQAKRAKGPMHDGAVRLAKPGRLLGIAEGVETALSAKRLYSLPVWASCGAQRMASMTLPDYVEEVLIFRDNGDAGLQAAIKAAEKFEDEGRGVMIEAPPAEFSDWNDVLRAREARP